MDEVWKPIEGYEGLYEVSNYGNIRSLNFHRENRVQILNQKNTKDGYLESALFKNKKPTFIRTHRLVANAFCPKVEEQTEVNHIDGDKKNNRADNLEWCTSSENQKHAYKLGLQKVSGAALLNRKKIKCVELNVITESLTAMQKVLYEKGLTLTTRLNRLSWAMNKGNQEYLGLHFEFVEGGR